ncbi:uncharacterized protein DUF1348 [Chitinophaga polysaccharea]|uniref:Uncharacterized protein DUF1348 n=1 Tax=Chitinophaga polysaccharea TaxID=1293035 RepID=A0A561PCQ8_9BACT|nr:DUF1348 family protein [Chitinophaga polysaccharea]TWF35846.1 uncharacterized protein DUF1348 [Chitinophaga polysaccharea]
MEKRFPLPPFTEETVRQYGNELWEFDENGLMLRRLASINDVAINSNERRLAEKES